MWGPDFIDVIGKDQEIESTFIQNSLFTIYNKKCMFSYKVTPCSL